jgi:lysophospholipase L1-like esterase
VTASFLALGDSYTIGEGVAEGDRWPAQLVRRLRAAGTPIDDPHIIARTGWTTDELLAAIRDEAPAGPFDVVTLLAGVNDQYRGRKSDRFREFFAPLFQMALGLAKLPECLIVLSIPDWGVTPFAADLDRPGIAREIDAFNDVIKTIVLTAGARYVDITPSSRRASHNSALLAADGLHPSASMYSIWVDQLEPLTLDALGASSEKR